MYSKLYCDNINVITLASLTVDFTRIALFRTHWDVKKDQDSQMQCWGKKKTEIKLKIVSIST